MTLAEPPKTNPTIGYMHGFHPQVLANSQRLLSGIPCIYIYIYTYHHTSITKMPTVGFAVRMSQWNPPIP